MIKKRTWGARELEAATKELFAPYLSDLVSRRTGLQQVLKLCTWLFNKWQSEIAKHGRTSNKLFKQCDKIEVQKASIYKLKGYLEDADESAEYMAQVALEARFKAEDLEAELAREVVSNKNLLAGMAKMEAILTGEETGGEKYDRELYLSELEQCCKEQ